MALFLVPVPLSLLPTETIVNKTVCGERPEKAIIRGRNHHTTERWWEQMAHLPEHPQKPVINRPKYSCHDETICVYCRSAGPSVCRLFRSSSQSARNDKAENVAAGW